MENFNMSDAVAAVAIRQAETPSDYMYTGLTPLPAKTVVTMAYVPFQTDRRTYDAEAALKNGTLFPSLDKPFTGRSNVK